MPLPKAQIIKCVRVQLVTSFAVKVKIVISAGLGHGEKSLHGLYLWYYLANCSNKACPTLTYKFPSGSVRGHGSMDTDAGERHPTLAVYTRSTIRTNKI